MVTISLLFVFVSLFCGVEKMEPSYTVGENVDIFEKHCSVLSHVRLFEIFWTVARQAPLSMGFFQARILEWVAISFSNACMHAKLLQLCPTLQPIDSSPPGSSAKTWKQPKCPLTDEWIKKMWYIYAMQYYLPIKK